MNKLIKLFLLTILIPTSAFAADDATKLECKVSETCLEKDVVAGIYNYTIAPNSSVIVEVTAKHGAGIEIKTSDSIATSSAMQIGINTAPKVAVEAMIPKDGKFSVTIKGANITVNGKSLNDEKATYGLKITRVGESAKGIEI